VKRFMDETSEIPHWALYTTRWKKAKAGQNWDFDRQGLPHAGRSEHGAHCALKCGLPSILQT